MANATQALQTSVTPGQSITLTPNRNPYITIDLDYGFRFSPLVGPGNDANEYVRIITGPPTKEFGWRAVYLGFNCHHDLQRFNLSRFRRLCPDEHLTERVAKPDRMGRFGFQYEIKITNGFKSPTVFWGKVGVQVLNELHLFLKYPSTDKQMPAELKRRSVLFPSRGRNNQTPVSKLTHYSIYLNGQYITELANHPNVMRTQPITAWLQRLQMAINLRPDEMIALIKSASPVDHYYPVPELAIPLAS